MKWWSYLELLSMLIEVGRWERVGIEYGLLAYVDYHLFLISQIIQ